MINKKPVFYLLHLLGIVLFLSIPVLSSPDFDRSLSFFRVRGFQKNLLSSVLLLLFFYLNYLYLLPKLYFSKKYLRYFVIIVICYFVVDIFPEHFFPVHKPPMPMPPGPKMPFDHGEGPRVLRFMPVFGGGVFFQFLLIFFLSFLLKISERLINLQNEKLKSEVSYLRAQINPHFLFNTLNGLYALTLEKSDAAPEAVLKLSSIMRYVVSESNKDFTPLENEIEYIKNYISLQGLRADIGSWLDFKIDGDYRGKQISPLLLIPFIENAFKYGLSAEEEATIVIHITILNDSLLLKVKNKKVAVTAALYDKSEKGIDNTRQRLEYLYPGKHKLDIFESDDFFEVQLLIQF